MSVYRLYSTLGTTQVAYSTRHILTASPNQDYVDTSSTLTMVDGEYHKKIRISIINDDLPELDEVFSVELTSVTGGMLILLLKVPKHSRSNYSALLLEESGDN